MKVAIYCRVFDHEQMEDVLKLMHQLKENKITPVLFEPFYEQLKPFLMEEDEYDWVQMKKQKKNKH